jgi:hypothetical protein
MALLADIAKQDFGVLLNTETKITIGDDQMKYDGKPQRMRVGDIVALGADEKNMRTFKVLRTETRANEIDLKEIQFFKAKISTGQDVDEVCVIAVDKQEAMKIVRDYSIKRGYKNLLSLNPSKFFKPFIEQDE